MRTSNKFFPTANLSVRFCQSVSFCTLVPYTFYVFSRTCFHITIDYSLFFEFSSSNVSLLSGMARRRMQYTHTFVMISQVKIVEIDCNSIVGSDNGSILLFKASTFLCTMARKTNWPTSITSITDFRFIFMASCKVLGQCAYHDNFQEGRRFMKRAEWLWQSTFSVRPAVWPPCRSLHGAASTGSRSGRSASPACARRCRGKPAYRLSLAIT